MKCLTKLCCGRSFFFFFFFFWNFDSYEYHMELCNELCLSIWSAERPSTFLGMAKTSTKFLHTCHTYRHHWLLPFCTTFTDLDLDLGSQGQCKENLCFLTLFSWSGWNLMWCLSNSSWTSSHYFLVRFKESWEISAVLWTAFKKTLSSHALGCLWLQIWYDDRYWCTLHIWC